MDKHGYPHRVDVSDELREIVLDFLISCMLEQPQNLPEYGIEFFTKLNEKRKTTLVYDYVQIEKSFSELTPREECSEKEIEIVETVEPEEEAQAEEETWASDWQKEVGEYLSTEKMQGGDVSTCEEVSTTFTEAAKKEEPPARESQMMVRKVSASPARVPKFDVIARKKGPANEADDAPMRTPTVTPSGSPPRGRAALLDKLQGSFDSTEKMSTSASFKGT